MPAQCAFECTLHVISNAVVHDNAPARSWKGSISKAKPLTGRHYPGHMIAKTQAAHPKPPNPKAAATRTVMQECPCQASTRERGLCEPAENIALLLHIRTRVEVCCPCDVVLSLVHEHRAS